MKAHEIAAHLLRTCPSMRQFQVYMFGSTLTRLGMDIDILVVGPSGKPLSKLKRELQIAGENLPLHILYMLPSEERHTRFVENQKCVLLTEVAPSGS